MGTQILRPQDMTLWVSNAHSPNERQADKAIVGKASPQASTQAALRLLVAVAAVVAASLVYRRPQMKNGQLDSSEDQSDNRPTLAQTGLGGPRHAHQLPLTQDPHPQQSE